MAINKPFDVSKFRKSITKSIDGISVGFTDPTDWISTNNYALNYLISGDFHKGVPLGKVTVFAGESGAGKSFICSGNLVKNAQEQGIYVILIDTENALDEAWLKALDVDTSEDKFLKLAIQKNLPIIASNHVYFLKMTHVANLYSNIYRTYKFKFCYIEVALNQFQKGNFWHNPYPAWIT
jgi:predicted ATP-dependent serine protease